ncbi:enoyl-CoA hydratase/isomerase family protein [Pimephales promelas]|nr:enoyl-CoA hydratase/isomerase family protein [Pimephales promelas]
MTVRGIYKASNLLKSSGEFWRIWMRKMSVFLSDRQKTAGWNQEDYPEQPQEEERSVSVYAGVSERKPPDRLTHTRPASRGPVFSSGHDLGELTSARGRKHHIKVFQTCSEVMTLIQDLPVPVIAMVNGVATAAGCQLVASCDIAVPTDKSTFATPGMSVGLFCSTPAVSIGRALPRKGAAYELLKGMCLDHYIQSSEAELWDVWTDIDCNDGRLLMDSSGGRPYWYPPPLGAPLTQHPLLSRRSGWDQTSNL